MKKMTLLISSVLLMFFITNSSWAKNNNSNTKEQKQFELCALSSDSVATDVGRLSVKCCSKSRNNCVTCRTYSSGRQTCKVSTYSRRVLSGNNQVNIPSAPAAQPLTQKAYKPAPAGRPSVIAPSNRTKATSSHK